MGAWKQFTTKDVTVTPFTANKGFTFTGYAITGSDVGINIYGGQDLPYNSPNNLQSGFEYFVPPCHIQRISSEYQILPQTHREN